VLTVPAFYCVLLAVLPKDKLLVRATCKQ